MALAASVIVKPLRTASVPIPSLVSKGRSLAKPAPPCPANISSKEGSANDTSDVPTKLGNSLLTTKSRILSSTPTANVGSVPCKRSVVTPSPIPDKSVEAPLGIFKLSTVSASSILLSTK